MEFGITHTRGAAVILTYPKNAFGNPKAFRAFVYGYGFICPEHPESVYEAIADREIFPNSERKLALDKSQMLLAHHIVSLLPVLCGEVVFCAHFWMAIDIGRISSNASLHGMFANAARLKYQLLCWGVG